MIGKILNILKKSNETIKPIDLVSPKIGNVVAHICNYVNDNKVKGNDISKIKIQGKRKVELTIKEEVVSLKIDNTIKGDR